MTKPVASGLKKTPVFTEAVRGGDNEVCIEIGDERFTLGQVREMWEGKRDRPPSCSKALLLRFLNSALASRAGNYGGNGNGGSIKPKNFKGLVGPNGRDFD